MPVNHVKSAPVLKYPFYTADVFTRQMFHGAQIAVFPHADGLTRDRMQLLAREMNLSETVFVFPSAQGGNHRRIRVFSPLTEIDFAGHPLIATGMVLAAIGDIKLNGKYTSLELEQNVGPVSVNITQADGKPDLIQFSRCIKPVLDRFTPPPEQLADILGLREIDLTQKKFHPLLVYVDQPCLIIPIKTYAAVRDARFNYRAWSESSAPASMAKDILMFTTQTDMPQSNFHARLVGPDIGSYDDPPIGSVMPAFTGYLCAHEHIKQGTHTFVIDRGNVTTRRSVLNIEMDHKGEETLTIRVGGPAVMVSAGTMNVPD